MGLCKSQVIEIQIQSVLHKIDKSMNLKRLKLCTILNLKIATKTVIFKQGRFSTKVVEKFENVYWISDRLPHDNNLGKWKNILFLFI